MKRASRDIRFPIIDAFERFSFINQCLDKHQINLQADRANVVATPVTGVQHWENLPAQSH